MLSQFRDDDNLNFRDGSASGVIFFCKVYSRLADYFKKKKLISSTFEEQVVCNLQEEMSCLSQHGLMTNL